MSDTLRIGALAILGACAALPLQATDPIQGLTTPLPRQAPMVEDVADLGNTRLWYWDTGGPGEVIVLLHPGSGSGEFYPYQQPAFARVGYRVISYSRRGHFGSEARPDADTHFAADDLLNLMKHLEVATFHLVGNALGGYVALDVAISHPKRVLSLVIANSLMGISEPEYKCILQSLFAKPLLDLPPELQELGPSYRAANPTGAAEWKKRHDRSGTSYKVRLRNEITWSALAHLKVPTLLITGDADLAFPPFLLNLVAERIPGCAAVVIPLSGHAAQWEQPEIFNRTVLEFIHANAPG